MEMFKEKVSCVQGVTERECDWHLLEIHAGPLLNSLLTMQAACNYSNQSGPFIHELLLSINAFCLFLNMLLCNHTRRCLRNILSWLVLNAMKQHENISTL